MPGACLVFQLPREGTILAYPRQEGVHVRAEDPIEPGFSTGCLSGDSDLTTEIEYPRLFERYRVQRTTSEKCFDLHISSVLHHLR